MDEQETKSDEQLERRRFLKSSALLGAGLFLSGGSVPMAGTQAARGAAPALYGQGGITSIAIASDCARLARHATDVSSPVSDVLKCDVNQEIPGNASLVGGLVPLNAEDAVTLLERFRANWTDREDDDGTEEKLAMVLGWMVHEAARSELSSTHQEAEASQPGLYPSEVSIYQDATVLRHRSSAAADAGNGQNVDDVEQLFRELGPRMIIRFHTFIPDYDDGSGWVDRMSSWRHEKGSLLHRLAEAYQSPDSEMKKRYVTEPNFYDEGDAIIQTARSVQNGEDPSRSVAAAVSANNESHYARALVGGHRRMKAASDYFAEEIGKEEVLNRLRA